MKILFYPYHLGYMHTSQNIAPVTGVPMTVPYTMKDMEGDLHGVTHNVGNTVHVEAPPRMLSYNTSGSASTFLAEMYRSHGKDPVATASEISKRFDYVLVSEANVFRLHGRNKDESETRTMRLRINADILDNLTIPFSVIGAGIQSIPGDDLDDFDSNIAYFLQVVDRKAEMLGVRGRATRDWLARAGISRNVKALGCPSLFLYPDNILGISYRALNSESSVLTAGYMSPKHIKNQFNRVNVTIDIAKSFKTDFVMQDDYYEISREQTLNHYNEAIGVVDRDFVLSKLQEAGLDASSINRFLHFRNSYSWRICCSGYDAYIGDRLHGGIVAMQAMRPAVIFHADFRVRELADLFGFPSAPISDVIRDGVNVVLEREYTEQRISDFKDNYSDLLKNFQREMANAGLTLRRPN